MASKNKTTTFDRKMKGPSADFGPTAQADLSPRAGGEKLGRTSFASRGPKGQPKTSPRSIQTFFQKGSKL